MYKSKCRNRNPKKHTKRRHRQNTRNIQEHQWAWTHKGHHVDKSGNRSKISKHKTQDTTQRDRTKTLNHEPWHSSFYVFSISLVVGFASAFVPPSFCFLPVFLISLFITYIFCPAWSMRWGPLSNNRTSINVTKLITNNYNKYHNVWFKPWEKCKCL